jgi:serine/threonine protein kinase
LLDKGFCHRDIKPENILVRPNGDLVLLDLGVLRPLVGSELTDDERGKRFVGSRRYAPPELQHRREEGPDAWEGITIAEVGDMRLS